MQDLVNKKGKSHGGRESFNFDDWCKEIDQHPAFTKELKIGPDGQYSAEIQALQALKYDKESNKNSKVSTSQGTYPKAQENINSTEGQHVFPLVILYPEHCQTDFIRECADDSLFVDVLYEVFEEPAEWDSDEHKFRASNVRICMALETQDGHPIVREILPSVHSLGEVLKWPDVVISDGVPAMQIYTKEWFSSNMKLIDKNKRIFIKK
uniref:Wheel domain-containing protein n=1 Tax=Meloidogyne hapla TaxID=6305 RepID=A0A1I8BGQ3_MELHA